MMTHMSSCVPRCYHEKKSVLKNVIYRKWNLRVKAPNAPKKSRSAYSIFYSEENDRMKKEKQDGWQFVALPREIGQRWSRLDEESRRPYRIRAAEEKALYEAKMEMNKKAKKMKREARPKRAKSSYNFYVQAWKSLSGESREAYAAQTREDKKRYLREMAAFRQGKFDPNAGGAAGRKVEDDDGEDPFKSDESNDFGQ